jgi:hypothetical protein
MRLPPSVLIVFALSAGSADAGFLVTASHRLPSPPETTFAAPIVGPSVLGAIPPRRYLQSFTAVHGGDLTGVAVSAVTFGQDPAGLSVSVTRMANGQPSEVLATAPLSGLGIDGRFVDPRQLNATADFRAQGVTLTADERYGLLFSTDRPNGNYQVLGGHRGGNVGPNPAPNPDRYTEGALLLSVNGEPFQAPPFGDVFFEVNIEAIPEPGSAMLGLLVIATLATLVQRSKGG